MNVLLVSQCDKRALTETRRILDQFAERRGARTWQTPITQDGLDTLRRLLRKTARKNTAVACHWIRGADHSELIWVVGDRSAFNDQGAVPTNTTTRNILRRADENDWHSGDLIRLLADLAGLLHDLGKAIEAFQSRLTGDFTGRNLIRHEWVSLRLFEAFVGDDSDADWLARLASPTADDDARWLGRLRRDGLDGALDSPFKTMQGQLARALGWLVVTHHRLPQLPDRAMFQMSSLPGLLAQVQPAWNERAFDERDAELLKPYWRFPKGLPVTTREWRARASRVARRLSLHTTGANAVQDVLANPFVMHLSRLSLMLADHHYSSLEGVHPERVRLESRTALLANTRRNGEPNQALDEHLVGVAQHGAEIARFLPNFQRHLPHLGKSKALKRRSTDERFRWQDKATELAESVRQRSTQHGAFIVNMASTGCGKTLANARVMYALADPAFGMRCSFALGLRTLTLQTGQAFRERLGLRDDDLAVRVGGSASRALFEHYEAEAEATGSASRQALLEEDSHVLYEGQIDQHPLLRRAVADDDVRKLLLAPLLVCTIDHLTPATESQRGGRQIAPMLRLMSGDLVLDEPDDFDLSDLPALTRLVHWAGLLGARVLLSSATLPPALVRGLFEAYRNGRHHFNRNCGARPGGVDTPPVVCCMWVDEFDRQAHDCPDASAFESVHQAFVAGRHRRLQEGAVKSRRRAELLPMHGMTGIHRKDLAGFANALAPQVLAASWRLHQAHATVDPVTTKRVSFGLVRMANIEPLVEVALALFRLVPPPGVRVHLCVYHSRHPLLVRSAIERRLDETLKRHQPFDVFQLADIRQRLDPSDEADHLFIVLGSPVTEVGRDHDYDWAVVEPSSMRSLIQLAGRVRRHRDDAITQPNILVFDHNLKHFRSPGRAAFCMPGFETEQSEGFHLVPHDLRVLMTEEQWSVIDARPRIVAPLAAQMRPNERLVDLEHVRLQHQMLAPSATLTTPTSPQRAMGARLRASVVGSGAVGSRLNASTWWNQAPADVLMSAVLQQQQPFRKQDGADDVEVALLPDEDAQFDVMHLVMKGQRRGEKAYVPNEAQRMRVPDEAVHGERITPWGIVNYMDALRALAAELDEPLTRCAERFGALTLPDNDLGWRYHPVLGFTKRR